MWLLENLKLSVLLEQHNFRKAHDTNKAQVHSSLQFQRMCLPSFWLATSPIWEQIACTLQQTLK